MATHPFGADAGHTVFVPAGFQFPDASQSAGAAQPVGAVQGTPVVDSVDGRIVTMQHPESGGQ